MSEHDLKVLRLLCVAKVPVSQRRLAGHIGGNATGTRKSLWDMWRAGYVSLSPGPRVGDILYFPTEAGREKITSTMLEQV